MGKDVFDGRRRFPVDRTAGNVVSTGIHFDCEGHRDPRDRREPYPTRPIPQSPTAAATALIVGRRYGRMLVIGLAKDVTDRWVVRCACGIYSLRRFASITNPANNNDCCGACQYVLKKMAGQVSSELGKKVHADALAGQHAPGEAFVGPSPLPQDEARSAARAATPSHRKMMRLTREERTQYCERNRLKKVERKAQQANAAKAKALAERERLAAQARAKAQAEADKLARRKARDARSRTPRPFWWKSVDLP